MIAGVELVRDKATGQPYDWAEQRGMQGCRHALTEGVWLRPLGNVIVIMPPLSIDEGQLDRILAAVTRGVDVATGTS